MSKLSIGSLILIPIALISSIFYFGSMIKANQIINVVEIGITEVSPLVLDPEDTYALTYEVSPLDANDLTVTWRSSDSEVVSVDESGNLVAISYGSATITVESTDGGFESSITVIVSERLVTGIDLLKDETTINVSDEETLLFTINPNGAINKDVTWLSSDANVVSVDANGKLVALSAGTATVIITTSIDTDSGIAYTDTITVTVLQDIESLELTTDSIISIHDSEISISDLLVIGPTDVSVEYSGVTYSLDSDIASVVDGVLVFTEAGEVTVTVTSDSNNALTDSVTVLFTDGYPLGISLDQTSLYLDMFDVNTGTITATIDPETGIIAPKDVITWVSDNEGVATVDVNGVVTGVSLGTSTITATTADGNHFETVTVTVGTSYIEASTLTLDKDTESLAVSTLDIITATVLGPLGETPTFTGVVWSIDGDMDNFNFYEDDNGAKGSLIEFTLLGTSTYRGNVIHVESLDGGMLTITATSEDNTNVVADTATYTTTILPDALAFTEESIIGFNDSINLAWSINSSAGNIFPIINNNITFEVTTNDTIASVDANGIVTFTSPGTITVTITSVANPALTDTIDITYSMYDLDETSKSIDSGANYTIIAEGLPGDFFDFTGNYTLSVPGGSDYVASDIIDVEIVNGNLKLIGKNHGTVTVTITASDSVFLDNERTFVLDVNEGPAAISWDLQAKSSDDYYVGTQNGVNIDFSVIGLTIDDIVDQGIEFVFSKEGSAQTSSELGSVTNNVVTFLDEGVITLTIRSTNNSIEESFTFTVNGGINVYTEQDMIDALLLDDITINLMNDIVVVGYRTDVFSARYVFALLGNHYMIDGSGITNDTDEIHIYGIFEIRIIDANATSAISIQDITVISNTGKDMFDDNGTPLDESDDIYSGNTAHDTIQVTSYNGVSRLGLIEISDSTITRGYINLWLKDVDVAIIDNVDLTNAYCESLFLEGSADVQLIDSTLGNSGYTSIDMGITNSLISDPDGTPFSGDEIVQTVSILGTTTYDNWIPADPAQSVFFKGRQDYADIYGIIISYVSAVHGAEYFSATGDAGMSVVILSQDPFNDNQTGQAMAEFSYNYSVIATDESALYNYEMLPIYQILEPSLPAEYILSFGFHPSAPTYAYFAKP